MYSAGCTWTFRIPINIAFSMKIIMGKQLNRRCLEGHRFSLHKGLHTWSFKFMHLHIGVHSRSLENSATSSSKKQSEEGWRSGLSQFSNAGLRFCLTLTCFRVAEKSQSLQASRILSIENHDSCRVHSRL